ncbi:uncharacterized protein LOC118232263 isoform X2 [Anguilla anguilla]|uniref:uncharacterized protein LOC118232263 isoform X2 n=1 Tax=Anguilla anguilla TaxID=7936 RepID=UPI0015AC94C6|nr:uncharacterized protein LOC118232263 isoform X2 [Anguilla anguilla]
MSVSVSMSPSGEIKEGSSVTLTCSSDANPPVQNYTWFRKNDTGAWQAGSGQSLNFSNFGSWNRGQYYCEAQNRLGAQNASALLVLIQDLQTGSERIVSFSNFTSWIFGQYYCVALNTHGDQTSAGMSINRHKDKTALVWRVVGITVAFALFTVMVCTSRKNSTNRERGRSRRSRTSLQRVTNAASDTNSALQRADEASGWD